MADWLKRAAPGAEADGRAFLGIHLYVFVAYRYIASPALEVF
jgi:hypothetical protein